MSDTAFGLVSSYGVVIILVATYLSCLAVPVPTSFIMLAGGGFAASGDLALVNVVLAAMAGAMLGDQTGFHIGRLGGAALASRLDSMPRQAATFGRARRFMDEWGVAGVFLSRWLISPLGPYVNLLAGATSMGWVRFTFWDVVGEAIWVAIYIGLGYAFASRIGQLAELLGNSIALLSIGAVTFVIGLLLLRRAQHSTTG